MTLGAFIEERAMHQASYRVTPHTDQVRDSSAPVAPPYTIGPLLSSVYLIPGAAGTITRLPLSISPCPNASIPRPLTRYNSHREREAAQSNSLYPES
jgi:hypothetical protein